MASLKGKEKLNTKLEYIVEITLDNTVVIDLLKTLGLFSINILKNIEREIKRLKDLTTNYPELNTNK